MQPVCVKCGREMRCERNGVVVYHPFEHATSGPIQQKVGNLTVVNVDRMVEGSWKEGDIDFVVQGDKYRCPDCGYEVVVGFGGYIMNRQKEMKEIVEDAKSRGEAIEIRRK